MIRAASPGAILCRAAGDDPSEETDMRSSRGDVRTPARVHLGGRSRADR
jgi:hypothetical protein